MVESFEHENSRGNLLRYVRPLPLLSARVPMHLSGAMNTLNVGYQALNALRNVPHLAASPPSSTAQSSPVLPTLGALVS